MRCAPPFRRSSTPASATGRLQASSRHSDRRPPRPGWCVACDLPFLDAATLDQLIAERDPARHATAFRSVHDGLPEPLCAIYEPGSREPILHYVEAGGSCPRKFLLTHDTQLLDPLNVLALDNANTPQDLAAVLAALAAMGAA